MRRKTDKRYDKITVTCSECKQEFNTTTENYQRWIGGILCSACNLERANNEYRSGGNWIVDRRNQ